MNLLRLDTKLCIIAIVLLAYLVTFFNNPSKQGQKETELMMVTDVNVSSLYAVASSVEQKHMALLVDNSKIVLLDVPPEVNFSDKMLKAYVYRMAHMPAERIFQQIENPEEFGFDKYTAAVVLLGKDGERIRLFLGDQVPFENLWYLMREGDKKLYLIDKITAQMMQYSADNFREFNIFPEVKNYINVQRLVICNSDRVLDIQGEEFEGAIHFTMLEPYEVMLSWEKVVQMLLIPLDLLKNTNDYVSSDALSESYGLYGKEAIILTVEIDGKKTQLRFASADDNNFYCAKDGGNDVVKVKREDAQFLYTKASDLIDATLYPRSVADVESIQVKTDSIDGEFKISGEGPMLRGNTGKSILSQTETVDLYKKLTMFPPGEPLDKEDIIEGKPILKLMIKLKNGMIDTVDLIPINNRRCAVVLNGESSMTTYIFTVREIIRICNQEFAY